jgi:hypothetical protein
MKRTLALALALAGAVLAQAMGCAPSGDERRATPAPSIASPAATAPPTAIAPSDAKAILPRNASPLAPSHLEVAGPGVDGNTVTETESCAGCHADAAAQWRTSAHSFGSFNNPIYRVVIDRFRKDVGNDKSRFCAGCHDVALLVDGAMAKEVQPHDPRGHGGITCRVCHGAETVKTDGNASYTLASSPIPIPKDGDAESLKQHKARMALAPLRTPQLCGSCHRAFLGTVTGNQTHIVGQDEMGQWAASEFAGSHATRVDEVIEKKECRECHMPKEDAPLGDAAAKQGKIASHRFLGAHTWMAAMRGDAKQVQRIQDMLRGAASIDVAAAVHEAPQGGLRSLPADRTPVAPGESILLDVVVRSLRVGHRFPAGTLDAQDTWIELTVHDAKGRLIAEAGTRQEKDGNDLSAHRLRAMQADDDGKPLNVRETHKFRTAVYNHTITPRDAEATRYRLVVPDTIPDGTLPYKVTARLRHRSRNLPLQQAACDDLKTPRGAAFAAEVKKRTGSALDPCILQPVTDVAEKTVMIGAGSEAFPEDGSVPLWRRLYDHALGMLHALQEQADEARPSLERALALAPTDRERAMVMALSAQIAVRQGRTEEALSWIDKASVALPGHPALAHIKGEAFSSVWRWKEATTPLRQAADATPGDDVLWMHLAVAYGSAGDPAQALEASKHGLALQPRDQDCLRVQSLALESLHAPQDEIDRARQAYVTFRNPDDAPRVRSLCSKTVPGCALERIPVHVHPLRKPR